MHRRGCPVPAGHCHNSSLYFSLIHLMHPLHNLVALFCFAGGVLWGGGGSPNRVGEHGWSAGVTNSQGSQVVLSQQASW